MRGSSMRFLRWYRLIPLLIVAVCGTVSFAYAYAPAPLFKLLYPLRYESEILDSSKRHGLDPYLVAAVIETESGWDANAESSQGAYGLMQLMPETAQDVVARGLVDPETWSAAALDDPQTNIELGCGYLAYLLGYFNGSVDKAIAAYNAGMGNVDDWTQEETHLHNAITFPETQAYLVRVTTARSRYQELYPDSFS